MFEIAQLETQQSEEFRSTERFVQIGRIYNFGPFSQQAETHTGRLRESEIVVGFEFESQHVRSIFANNYKYASLY